MKNYEELTGALNKFRMEHLSKTFSREELVTALREIGFNHNTAQSILSFIPSEKIGTSKLYTFSKDPIHKNLVEGVYRNDAKLRKKSAQRLKGQKSENSPEEKAIATLQAAGYQIRKIVGFDMERFQKENPVLYKKYLKYEII
jgi:hypothetical protein